VAYSRILSFELQKSTFFHKFNIIDIFYPAPKGAGVEIVSDKIVVQRQEFSGW